MTLCEIRKIKIGCVQWGSRMNENETGKIIVDTAVRIHKELGPGLLESVYEVILTHELLKLGLTAERQVGIGIEWSGLKFEEGYRADIIVEKKVIIELKSVEVVSKAHKKQLLTYLKLGNYKLGYLLNFGAALMRDGIFRIINGQLE